MAPPDGDASLQRCIRIVDPWEDQREGCEGSPSMSGANNGFRQAERSLLTAQASNLPKRTETVQRCTQVAAHPKQY